MDYGIYLPTEERWALTFVLKTYFDIPQNGYCLDGSLKEITIKQGLQILFYENIHTSESLSLEIKRCIEVYISARYLQRYSDGMFMKLKIVEVNDIGLGR